MKKRTETLVTHSGRNPKKNFGAVNPPVYHVSTVLFDDFAAFQKSWLGTFEGLTYGRHGSESHRELENALAKLEGADKSLLTCSGCSAITVTLLALLKSGDHLLVPDNIYSPTRSFCDADLKRLGVETTYYDPLVGGDIKKLFKKNTKVVYVESPGSLTMEVQDVPAISKAAHAINAVVVLDNTWATPLYFKAFEKGVDVSIHSATKYISGHSDVMMGVINCTKKLYPAIKSTYKNIGITLGPDDVYLAQRGLRTLAVRLKEQGANAFKIAKFLESHPKVETVLYPALKSDPGHKIWKRDFTGASGLLSFVLKKPLDDKGHSNFLDKMELLNMGYSWGGYESLIIPFELSKIRTATRWKYKGAIFRISVGLENVDDLISDLSQALSRV